MTTGEDSKFALPTEAAATVTTSSLQQPGSKGGLLVVLFRRIIHLFDVAALPSFVFALTCIVQIATHWQMAQTWDTLLHLHKHNWAYIPRHSLWTWWGLPVFLAGFAFYGSRAFGLARSKPRICLKIGWWGALSWSRNAFCRGWIITGATGTGKTECCVNLLLHQLFQREAGNELPSWNWSKTRKQFLEVVGAVRKLVKTNGKLVAELEDEIFGVKDPETRERTGRDRFGNSSLEARLLTAKDEELAAEHAVAMKETPALRAELATLRKSSATLEEAMKTRVSQIDELNYEVIKARRDLNQWTDKRRHLRFKMSPFGGLCLDQKGVFWQSLVKMSEHYDRDADLCLLQTRPNWASELWEPPARLNLLSCSDVPSNTYATAIVKTATAMAGGEGDKGFFKTQAEQAIGAAISLMRAVQSRQVQKRWPKEKRAYPALDKVHEILTSEEEYKRYLIGNGCVVVEEMEESQDDKTEGDGVSPLGKSAQPRKRAEIISAEIHRWMTHFEERFWSQPSEQLGGVQGTISNYLTYFTADDVAEVFCRDNTFELADIEKGKLICLSMPQKLQVERRYVSTLLKILVLQQAQRRFDLRSEDLGKVNLVVIMQDEAQRFIIEEDRDVDTLRQAVVTSVLATQDIPSLYPPLGGKEKATSILLNLRNRIIGKAADTDGAKASAEFIGEAVKRRPQSFTRAFWTFRTKVNWKEEYELKVHPGELRALPDFTFYVCHSEGLMRKFVIRPRTEQNKTPRWWRGAVRRTGKWFLTVIVFFTPWAPEFWELKIPKAAKKI